MWKNKESKLQGSSIVQILATQGSHWVLDMTHVALGTSGFLSRFMFAEILNHRVFGIIGSENGDTCYYETRE
jgi:hypothetical protein